MTDAQLAGRARFFALGDVVVDRDTRTVLREGEAVRLEPRVFALLDYLVAQGGREVSRAELVAEVWLGTHVVDEAVHRAVSMLRSALGDSAQRPTYLLTTPRRGYRLLHPVEPGLAPAPPTPRRFSRRHLAYATGTGLIIGVALTLLWRTAPVEDQSLAPMAPAAAPGAVAPGYAPPAPG